MIENWHEEGIILAGGFALFAIYAAFDGWLLKKHGSRMSTIRGTLIDDGYDSTYGLLVALIYPVSVTICTLVYILFYSREAVSIKQLAISTGVIYAILVFTLNVWGKRYLLSKGLSPRPKNGYKGFRQSLRENIEKKKQEQRQKRDELLL
ncbi:MAG: hypothetical protein GF398_15135 [Chitinivibrionales bacterium]|nr:hypothetical protein [Chitinivibrionales bacterium]